MDSVDCSVMAAPAYGNLARVADTRHLGVGGVAVRHYAGRSAEGLPARSSRARGVTIAVTGRVRSLLRRGRRRLPPALDASLYRRVRRPRHPQPSVVSVVVPFYDVEQYFATCLNSLIRQTYRNLEIILVDDGSPDGSLAIARSYRRWDRRIRIVRQVNQGLGAARNTGLAAATGRYVTFVDSDDVLPRMAISTMVRTLESTGSDFVVGGLRRFEQGVKAQTPPWVEAGPSGSAPTDPTGRPSRHPAERVRLEQAVRSRVLHS